MFDKWKFVWVKNILEMQSRKFVWEIILIVERVVLVSEYINIQTKKFKYMKWLEYRAREYLIFTLK